MIKLNIYMDVNILVKWKKLVLLWAKMMLSWLLLATLCILQIIVYIINNSYVNCWIYILFKYHVETLVKKIALFHQNGMKMASPLWHHYKQFIIQSDAPKIVTSPFLFFVIVPSWLLDAILVAIGNSMFM